MKYNIKCLQHNGVYVPPYDYKGLSVKVQGIPIKLSPKTEQMAIAWVRKEQSQTSPPDTVFKETFTRIFLEEIRKENPSKTFPEANVEVDFSEVKNYVLEEQAKKLNMTKEEKKRVASERKQRREKLKEHYGYAEVDGNRIEIANWTAEPSCLFAGRGDHPRRGAWKDGPREEDITLNLSPDSPCPPGNWKAVVWEPDKMYIAKWVDKLCGKVKYVWFSDAAFLKQNKEKEKFSKARKLNSYIPRVEAHITKNLNAEDATRRKVATVAWLVHAINLRVGDEKDPGEADTVGAITLRPEHINIGGNVLHFDFLGKDAVRWVKSANAPQEVVNNIAEFSKNCREYLFEGIDSKKVSRFLSEVMPGLTAKVFRTWRCTETVKDTLNRCTVKKEDPEHLKNYCAKMANLEAAKVANHKRKIPANYDERVAKKEARVKQLEAKIAEKKAAGKKTEALLKSFEKTKKDVTLMKETKEYNLGTSLKSYIDPMVYVKWASSIDFSLDKFYPKTLKNKFSWALGSCSVRDDKTKKEQ